MQATEFWDNIFAQGDCGLYSRVAPPDPHNPILLRAQRHFGDVRGRRLVDLGCGRGDSSLYFASLGADVISVDLSAAAIGNLQAYCRAHGVGNVTPVQLSAL